MAPSLTHTCARCTHTEGHFIIKEICNQLWAAVVPIATRDTCTCYCSMHAVYLCIHPHTINGYICVCVCVVINTLNSWYGVSTLQASQITFARAIYSEAALWHAEKVNGTCRAIGYTCYCNCVLVMTRLGADWVYCQWTTAWTSPNYPLKANPLQRIRW